MLGDLGGRYGGQLGREHGGQLGGRVGQTLGREAQRTAVGAAEDHTGFDVDRDGRVGSQRGAGQYSGTGPKMYPGSGTGSPGAGYGSARGSSPRVGFGPAPGAPGASQRWPAGHSPYGSCRGRAAAGPASGPPAGTGIDYGVSPGTHSPGRLEGSPKRAPPAPVITGSPKRMATAPPPITGSPKAQRAGAASAAPYRPNDPYAPQQRPYNDRHHAPVRNWRANPKDVIKWPPPGMQWYVDVDPPNGKYQLRPPEAPSRHMLELSRHGRRTVKIDDLNIGSPTGGKSRSQQAPALGAPSAPAPQYALQQMPTPQYGYGVASTVAPSPTPMQWAAAPVPGAQLGPAGGVQLCSPQQMQQLPAGLYYIQPVSSVA
eukprot:TRINITY_DN47835_c0_g1_i1.p1 TRINITY_DN47835_c0_g1~~TRINITY_DN47835_c0_g1_i1.p1  ORF type:complete len:402 (+),score=65.63 TRINITY_DN47835_c0_g1_i1:93-1208(+)